MFLKNFFQFFEQTREPSIFYEKFGSDKKRTVLNKLFSSTAWAVSFYYIFGQLIEAFLYIHGPLPASFCLAHMIYKRAATTQVKSDNIRLVLPRQEPVIINKFQQSSYMPHSHKVISLVKRSHVAWNYLPKSFISAQHSCATLKLVYDINCRSEKLICSIE